MATDASGTPTSPDSIATILPSDLPAVTTLTSGVNAIAATVQTALTNNYLRKTSGNVVNADISGAAAIAYSKLNLANSIVSGDIVDGTIVNADINAAAAIAMSKLAIGSGTTGQILANQGGTAVFKNIFSNMGWADASADQTLTTTLTDLTGATLTKTILGVGTYVCIGIQPVQMTATDGNAAECDMAILLDGSEPTAGAYTRGYARNSYSSGSVTFTTVAATMISCAFGTVAAGAHTWKLQARELANNSSTNSTLGGTGYGGILLAVFDV